MKLGNWIGIVIVLVIGYFIGKTYPNIFARIGSAAG